MRDGGGEPRGRALDAAPGEPRSPALEDGAGAPGGWVLYDGACGVCARWVPFWAPTLGRLGLAVAPLQAPWVAARLDVGPESLVADIRLLTRDGRLIAGADVYRHVMRRLWWAFPLYLLTVAPGLRRLFDRGYRVFADHRLGISRACGLRPPPGSRER